jgi:hypothetical protein
LPPLIASKLVLRFALGIAESFGLLVVELETIVELEKAVGLERAVGLEKAVGLENAVELRNAVEPDSAQLAVE